MISRRVFFQLTAPVGATACLEPPSSDVDPIWLEVSKSADGVKFRVNNESVEREALGQVLLAHATVAHPGMTPDQAQAEMQIYVRLTPGVSMQTTRDLMSVLDRFGRAGIVAEDRRS